MTDRERFEAWASNYAGIICLGRGLNTANDEYGDETGTVAWWAWQESRRQMAEEAIDVVAFHGGSVEIEANIRARANPDGEVL